MAADEQLIALKATGPDPDDWTTVASLLANSEGISTAMEWSYSPFSTYVVGGDMLRTGKGFPVVVWSKKAVRYEQREALRAFCSGLSSEVYIRTPTNETVLGVRQWKDFLCVMNWMPSTENQDVFAAMDIEITFTRCVEVGS